MGANSGKAAIFDLDGTLLDSMGAWDQVDIDFLGRRGIEVPDDYMSTVSSMQFRQIAEYTIKRFDLDDTPEDLMDEWTEMATHAYATIVEAKPHALQYLAYLRQSGAKLAVATTLLPSMRVAAMRHTGLDEYFDVICSVDEVGDTGKEEPDVYLKAAQLLNVEPKNCTVFEDILVGIRSAKSVGMHAWAMHDDSSDLDWQTICDEADGIMFDFSDAPVRL